MKREENDCARRRVWLAAGGMRHVRSDGALLAQEAREPVFKLFAGEELLRLSGAAAVLAASRIVIQQELRSLDEQFAGWLAVQDRDKLEPRSLLEIQINVHMFKPKLCRGPVN